MALGREFERGECGAQKLVAEEQPLLPLEARWGLDTGSLAGDGHGAARGGSEERFGPFFPPPAGLGPPIAGGGTDDAGGGRWACRVLRPWGRALRGSAWRPPGVRRRPQRGLRGAGSPFWGPPFLAVDEESPPPPSSGDQRSPFPGHQSGELTATGDGGDGLVVVDAPSSSRPSPYPFGRLRARGLPPAVAGGGGAPRRGGVGGGWGQPRRPAAPPP